MSCQTRFVARWHGLRSLLVLALIVAFCPVSWGEPTAPGPGDRQITQAVTLLLKREHLTHHPLDNEISKRCLKEYLKSLDRMKVYFYQSDVDKFMQHEGDLSEWINKRDYESFLKFGYMVFHVFLQRVDERVKMVDDLLAAQHDFSADEEMTTDRDQLQYPRDAAEAYDRWRKRVKYDLLVMKATKTENKKDGKKEVKKEGEANQTPDANGAKPEKSEKDEAKEAIDRLTRRYHSFAKRMHQYDSDELLEVFLNSFTMSFDPHTDYMSPETEKNFEIAMSLQLEGIGASLESDDGYTIVRKVVPRGAADKDGRLKTEDKIVGVGQETGEIVDVVDMKLSDVVKLIRGKRETIVRLEVIPADGSERKIYKLAREKIELKDSEARGAVFEAGRKTDGSPYRVGVIDLPSFYRDIDAERRGDPDFKSATRDVRTLLNDFSRKGVDAVVLDLRANGGGSLPEAVSLTGLFINDGPVVQVKAGDSRAQHLDVEDPGTAWNGPLVLLISKFSASASEILAGAIQDYGRGLIVGDHSTHGKGTVQSLLDLGQQLYRSPNTLGALKITTQQFYRPDGDSTQKRGVLSDLELPSLTTYFDVGEADLDYPVEFDKVGALRHKHFGQASGLTLDQLRAMSQQRVQGNEKFQKVVRNIARYQEQKAKKSVTLNEARFLKERAELNADKEEEKAFEKHSDMNGADIERDFYLDEVMAIAIDYMNIDHVAKTGAIGVKN
jgi:carboxyl-terminal processing protease